MRPDLAAQQELVPTVGWDGGPGTGRTADDNASWGVEGAPAILQASAWEVAHSDRSHTVLTAESQHGESFRIQLERQGDGAWAYRGLG